MAFDENVYELRRQKLKQIEALGQTAYRSKYEFTHTIPQILAEYSDKTAEQLENPRVEGARGRPHHGDSTDGQGGILPLATGRPAAADLCKERCGRRYGIRAYTNCSIWATTLA